MEKQSNGISSTPLIIDFVNNKITDSGTCKDMRSMEHGILYYFIINKGQLLSRNQIVGAVWGENGCTDANLQGTISKMGKRFPSVGECIETVKGIGYRFVLPPNCVIVFPTDAKEELDENLPHSLTTTPVALETEKSVIHREPEIRSLERLLSSKKSTIILCGPGGVGKSSLARVLYSKLALTYESIGWIQYHKNLKESILASIDLYVDIKEPEKRWSCISKRFRNDLSSKLLIVDNVDLNLIQEQDPLRDMVLQEITGWPNMSIILTSRISDIHGYLTFPIDCLGDETHPEPCVDLFYYYYDRNELDISLEKRYQLEAVLKLIQYAGYHTYAIELLARSAKYEDSLDEFAVKIGELGFQFPNQKFLTSNRNFVATAAEQLSLLFDRRGRSELEQQILWDFSILPENTVLSTGEARFLLAYSPNEMADLCRDSWLLFEKGQGFHIHPLVKEVIHFDLQDGKAPNGTVAHLIMLVRTQKLITAEDSQTSVLRKLTIVENAAKYIPTSFPDECADFYYNLGFLEFQFARKRLTCIEFLEKSLHLYQLANSVEGKNLDARIAEVKYQLGYAKSTTNKYRHDSEIDLRGALEAWQSLGGHECELAMAHDHLGYVLSDNANTFSEAHAHLLEAIHIRKNVSVQYPTIENIRAYATTCDNLGCLYAKWPSKTDHAEDLLTEAFQIRERIYQETGNFITDVAWTAFNLGQFLSSIPGRLSDAEFYLRKALEMRRLQEHDHPGMYTTNVVFTLVALAKLLRVNPEKAAEVCTLTSEALQLREKIDSEHTGFFSQEIEKDIISLVDYTRSNTGRVLQ